MRFGVVKPLRVPRQRILKQGQLESIRDAKGWLTQRMAPGRSYREVRDQAAFTARMDLQQARLRAPSFDKMWRAVENLLR